MSTITYDEYLSRLEQQYQLPPGLGKAQMMAESSGNPNAVSPAGAVGIFQFMPDTARRFGIDPRDPLQAAQGWARYMRSNLDRFGGDLTQAVAAYNAGEGAVERHKGVPPYKETQTYVQRVLGALTPVQGAQAAEPKPRQLTPEQQARLEAITPTLEALDTKGASEYEISQILQEELGLPPVEPLGPGGRVLNAIGRNAPMIAGMGASLAAPGIGTAALAGGLASGLTRFVMEPQEPAQAAVEGASTAAGTAALGYGLQGLAAGARRVLPPIAQSVSEWAARRGIPSPPASRIGQTLARTAQAPLAGELVARSQGRAMVEAANREAQAMAGGTPDPGNVAAKAATYFADVVKGAKGAGDAAYEGVRAAVGANTMVSTPSTLAALGGVIDRLRASGVTPETATGLTRKLFGMADDAARTGRTQRTWRDFYANYQELLKSAGGKARSELKDIAPMLREAMEQDITRIGAQSGQDLLGLHVQAGKRWNELQALLKGSNIQQFTQVKSNPAGYLNQLLTEPNAKLLARLRDVNPALHQEVLEAGVAAMLGKSSGAIADTGQVLINGPALARYVDSNARWLREIYGPERTQALQSFAAWAARAYPQMAKASRTMEASPGRLAEMSGLGGAVTWAGMGKGGLPLMGAVVTQAGAAWLAHSLVAPNGTLFRVFSGLPPARAPRAAGAALGNLLTPSLGQTPPELGRGR